MPDSVCPTSQASREIPVSVAAQHSACLREQAASASRTARLRADCPAVQAFRGSSMPVFGASRSYAAAIRSARQAGGRDSWRELPVSLQTELALAAAPCERPPDVPWFEWVG